MKVRVKETKTKNYYVQTLIGYLQKYTNRKQTKKSIETNTHRVLGFLVLQCKRLKADVNMLEMNWHCHSF